MNILAAIGSEKPVVSCDATIRLSFLICIFVCATLTSAKAQKPDAADQSRALAALKDYALNYTKGLPNFICTQITQRTLYPDIGIREFPHHDAIEEQITFASRKEAYKVVRVNGVAVVNVQHDQVGGIVSSGEFGSLLANTFAPDTGAEFHWERTANRNGHKVYVFVFQVPQMKGYELVETRRTLLAPYKGRIYADAENGAVERIELECEMPRDSEYKALEITLDYKSAEVAGREFLLPSHYHFRSVRAIQLPGSAPTSARRVSETINEADYKSYRRYDTDSSIGFETDTAPRKP
jgi:hypothetical protein